MNFSFYLSISGGERNFGKQRELCLGNNFGKRNDVFPRVFCNIIISLMFEPGEKLFHYNAERALHIISESNLTCVPHE